MARDRFSTDSGSSGPTRLDELDRPEIEAAVAARGLPALRGRQIFRWIHRKGASRFEDMTNLPAALRATLADAFSLESPAVVRRQTSADGTTKFLLRLADGAHIESVYIPDTPAETFCIS